MPSMTDIVPAEEMSRPGQSANLGDSATSPRQAGEDKRRFMEREKAHFGPDGPRSLWRSRIFSVGVRMFDLGARLAGVHQRGRRNAPDVRLTAPAFPLPPLPLA